MIETKNDIRAFRVLLVYYGSVVLCALVGLAWILYTDSELQLARNDSAAGEEGGTGTTNDLHQYLLVLAAGVLGSSIHAVNSFATYIGRGEFDHSWLVWYYFRPVIGAMLALVFYFLIRGSLLLVLDANANNVSLDYYGIAAVSAIVGMFSKQATDRLAKVFDTLFE